MSEQAQRFEALVESEHADGTGGHWVNVPDAVAAALGGGARIPVATTIGGKQYRTSLARMGGTWRLGLLKDVRVETGIVAGQRVALEIARDHTPRAIETPSDLARALDDDAEAHAAYERLSFTHRKEYVRWITEAKRDATRSSRVAKAVTMLRSGVKTPDAPKR